MISLHIISIFFFIIIFLKSFWIDSAFSFGQGEKVWVYLHHASIYSNTKISCFKDIPSGNVDCLNLYSPEVASYSPVIKQLLFLPYKLSEIANWLVIRDV